MSRRLPSWIAPTVTAALVATALCVLPAAARAHDGEHAPTIVDGIAWHSDQAAELPTELLTRPLAQAALRDPAPISMAAAAELPEMWCGTPRATDDAVNAVTPAAASIKVVYARASDQPDRFPEVAHRLQANVALLSRYVAGQAAGLRTIRFDMGTSCGAEYVDIQSIVLPNPLSHYVVGGAPQFSRLATDARAAVAPAPGPRNLAVYADGMRGGNGVSGTAQFFYGDAAEAPDGAWHNQGGLVAAVWGRAVLPDSPYADPTTMLHEITHNLGAVQGSAPHSTGMIGSEPAGHCFDEQDVMCYRDGGPNNVLTYTCALRADEIAETYDCGGDDYFSADPAPGSWLATHWNVFDSDFLGSCATELATTCGATGSGDAYAPENTTPVPPSGWVAGWSPTLSGSDAESPPVSLGQWRLDNGKVVSSTSASVTAEGVHTLATRVADRARNWSPWRRDVVKVDATPPGLTLNCSRATGGYACRAAASDARSGLRSVVWSRDRGPAKRTSGRFTVRGGGLVRATATDRAGHTTTVSATLVVRGAAAKTKVANGETASGAPAQSALPLKLRRSGHARAVAVARITMRGAGRSAEAEVSVPPVRAGRGRWRTRICVDTCRTFTGTSRQGRLPARLASWPAKGRRGDTVRVTVERRAGGRWVAVLAGRGTVG